MNESESKRGWAPVDIIVAGLSAVVIIVFGGVMIEGLIRDENLTDTQAERLAGLLGGVISIISLYVGACLQKRVDARQRDEEKGLDKPSDQT